MATIVNQTHSDQVKNIGTTTYTLTIPATTAGNKLLLVCYGGATVTAKITNSSGAAFTQRDSVATTQAISIHEFTCVGGETAVFVTLSGAENTSYDIFEISGLGSFISGAHGNGTAAQASDWQAKASTSHTVAGNAFILTAVAVSNTSAVAPFSLTNRWRQAGPLGKHVSAFGNQPGSASQFVAAAIVADVTTSGAYPATNSAGVYTPTSVWHLNAQPWWLASVSYNDPSGVPTVTLPSTTVAQENTLPGTDQGNWYPGLNGGTDALISGYTDKLSYQPGDTVNFKVYSNNNTARVELYRRGWYGYDTFGARSALGNQAGYLTVTPTVQPAPTVDGTLGSTSCAWTTNATWTIPSATPSGVYQAIFRRTDAGNTAHFSIALFVVRPASVTGKVVVVVPDYTYAAYNVWGGVGDNGTLGAGTWTGRSIYQIGTDGGTPNFAHRAYATSFDRPMSIQATQTNTWFDDAEMGVVNFLEGQGCDLVYLSTSDLEADPTVLMSAKAAIMNGHHEYLTPNVYNAFLNAANNGVNLAVFGSNTALWRVRFAAGDTNKRTMICYKDSGSVDVSAGFDAGTGLDPVSYTGTWRDSRTGVSPFNPDVRRENALTGQLFSASTPSNVQTTVPFASKTLPIWRNSPNIQALTVGNSYTHAFANVGDEVDLPDGSTGQPTNMVQLCPTTASWSNGSNPNGSAYHTTITNATATFTLYWRNGALVFNTGSWRGWWGVSRYAKGTFNVTVTTPSIDWQNALLAVMYDLGVTPVAVTAMRPGVDTAPTDPATGAPVGSKSQIGAAYGLTFTATPGPVVVSPTSRFRLTHRALIMRTQNFTGPSSGKLTAKTTGPKLSPATSSARLNATTGG